MSCCCCDGACEGRVGEVSPAASYLTRVWIAAGLAGAVSRAARSALPALSPLVVGGLVLPLFGVLFLGVSRAAGVPVRRVES